MSIQIVKKPIPIKKRFNTEGIRNSMMAILDSAANEVKKDLESITGTWTHKVDFRVEVRIFGGDAVARITTRDKIFHFINEGTRVRYALMSPDWKSKTAPGRLRSGSGRGRVLYIGKRKPWRKSRKRWPRPGIKARAYMTDAQRRATRKFQREASMIKFKGKLLV